MRQTNAGRTGVVDGVKERYSYAARLAKNPGDAFVELDVEEGGTLDAHLNRAVRWGGSLTIVGRPPQGELLVKVTRYFSSFNGYIDEVEQPLGVFLAESPSVAHGDGVRYTKMDLYDLTALLDQDIVPVTFEVGTTAPVTSYIENLIIGAWGDADIALTPSTKVLREARYWAPGTSKLKIINDLLDAIGYFALHTNTSGQFVVRPYVLPRDRLVAFDFIEGNTCIHKSTFTEEVDSYSIPNKVIVLGQTSGENKQLVGVAVNMNPQSPYSYQSLGRWKTEVIQDTTANVDQETLDKKAHRSLVERSAEDQTVTITHVYVPLELNDIIYFKSDDLEGYYAIAGTKINLKSGLLCTTTMRRVSRDL